MTCGWIVLGVLAAAQANGDAPKSTDPRLVVERFAAEPDVVTPTGLAVDARGRVLVVESHTHFRPENYAGPPADRIRLLEDTDGDGRADRVSTFFEGSKFTMGLRFHPAGALFVATRYEIFRLRDADGDGRADGPPEPVAKLETAGNYPHNGLSGFAFDAEGRVVFGLGENLGASYKLVGHDGKTLSGGGEGGSLYRINPDGTGLTRVATGFWNPFGQAFDAFGRLFVVDNDPDARPPCRLLHVVPGGDYGFRFRNGRKGLHPFTAWNGELPGTLPMTAGTGEAPSGVLAYESDNFPEAYRGDLLTTSWGDHRVERFRLKPQGASFLAAAEPLVVGGEDFRPVAIAAAPDGSVYLTDWVDKSYALHGKGRVWRLRAKDAPKRQASATDEDALGHPDRPTREAAARRLAASEAGRKGLSAAVLGHADPRARAAALDALWNWRLSVWSRPVPGDVADAFRGAFSDRSDDVRALAVRRLDGSWAGPDRRVDAERSPLVRAEHLRRFGYDSGNTTALNRNVAALSAPDPFLRQAARHGLKQAVGPGYLESLFGDGTPAERREALLFMREGGGDPDKVLPAALKDADPEVRFVAIRWAAEERLTKYRDDLRAGLASGSVTRQLFEAYLAALERLDGKSRVATDEQAGEGYVAALVADPKTPTAVLSRALKVLRPDHPALTAARLKAFLKSGDPAVRLEAVRTLRDGSWPGRFALLAIVAGDREEPTALRAEAVVGLADDAGARRGLLLGLAEGGDRVLRHEALRSLRGLPLTPAENDRAAAYGRQEPETTALLAMWSVPKDPQPGKPEPLAAWLARLEGPADPEAGERIFFHPKGPGCYRCHEVDGRGARVGPALSTAAASLTRERLVESILDPSKEVAPQFVAWSVARKDGSVFTGTLVEESASGEQIYADAKGERIAVKASDVEERRPEAASIMPADLARRMTPQEFRDLIAFLRAGR